jgi:hypothetical protein
MEEACQARSSGCARELALELSLSTTFIQPATRHVDVLDLNFLFLVVAANGGA